MRRALLGILLLQVLFAGFAMASPGSETAPAPDVRGACHDTGAPLLAGNPLDGAVFLAPPNGCASICSTAQGKSCSPEGSSKTCYSPSEPDTCLFCFCTGLTWNCGF